MYATYNQICRPIQRGVCIPFSDILFRKHAASFPYLHFLSIYTLFSNKLIEYIDIPRPLSNDLWVILFQKVDA